MLLGRQRLLGPGSAAQKREQKPLSPGCERQPESQTLTSHWPRDKHRFRVVARVSFLPGKAAQSLTEKWILLWKSVQPGLLRDKLNKSFKGMLLKLLFQQPTFVEIPDQAPSILIMQRIYSWKQFNNCKTTGCWRKKRTQKNCNKNKGGFREQKSFSNIVIVKLF